MALNDLIQHFFKLFGRRNRIFLSSLSERIGFLNLAIADLQEAIRKDVGERNVSIALARIISRIFCIAEHFYELPLVYMMAKKYPDYRCSYCNNAPCSCKEKRSAAQLQEKPYEHQIKWSLSQWAQHFDILYGKKNKESGIENILNRLFKEVAEFLCLEMSIRRKPDCLDLVEEEFALELADALAWTVALANYFSIDIEMAVIERYGVICPTCKEKTCCCGTFNVEQVRWENK